MLPATNGGTMLPPVRTTNRCKMWMKGLKQWLKDYNFYQLSSYNKFVHEVKGASWIHECSWQRNGLHEIIFGCSKSPEKLVESEPERIHFQVESSQVEWHCITSRICKGQRHWRPEIIPRTMICLEKWSQCSHGKKALKANHQVSNTCEKTIWYIYRSKGTLSERNVYFSTSVNSVVFGRIPH